MKKLMALALVAWALALAGCNTMQGFGKDLENLGERIQKKSAQ